MTDPNASNLIRARWRALLFSCAVLMAGCVECGSSNGTPGEDASSPGASRADGGGGDAGDASREDASSSYALTITSPSVGAGVDPAALSVDVTIEPAPPEGAELVLRVDSLTVSAQTPPSSLTDFTMADVAVGHLESPRPRELTATLTRGGEVLATSAPVTVTLSRSAMQQEDLFAESTDSPRIEFQGGRPWLVRANVPIPAASSVERAYAFLRRYDALLNLPGDLDEDFYLEDVQRDRRALPGGDPVPLEVVRLSQRAHGVPVALSDITVVMRGDQVLYMTGQWLQELPSMPASLIGMARARAIAGEQLATLERTLAPRLFFYDRSLDWDPSEGARPAQDTKLAWRVPTFGALAGGSSSLFDVWVDAETGEVLELQNRQMDLSVLEDDPNLDVVDYGNDEIGCPLYTWVGGGTLDCDENGCDADAQPDSVVIQDHSLTMYDWSLFTFGFYSFDDRNQKMRSYTRVEQGEGFAAFYKPWCEIWGFGDGNTTAFTFGHEYMHAITHHTIGLNNSFSARVTIEATANIFGAIYTGHKSPRKYSCGETFANADKTAEPSSRACNPDPSDTAQFYADHVSEYDKSEGYYYNASIASRAFGIALWGGTHLDSGVTITRRVGRPEDFVRAYFDLFELRMLPSGASISRFLTIWREHVRTKPYGMSEDDVCALINGVAAVGVGVGDTDCDQILDDVDDDLDGDHIPNDADNCPQARNYAQLDRDGDGVGDACDDDVDGDGVRDSQDNCNEPNPDQADLDGDSIGDACQDPDGDTIPASQDICPDLATTREEQIDIDRDGLGNACDEEDDGDGVLDVDDNCPLIKNPPQVDVDGDGVGNACDNCHRIPNPDQADLDTDLIGDVCDDDDDGDGVLDVDDNCPRNANPDQEDYDGNGVGYECDAAEKAQQWEAGFGDGADIAVEIVESWGLYAMPFPLCASGCDSGLSPGTLWTISIVADTPFFSAIMDDGGAVVATGEPGANGLTELVFEPSQSFFSLANANAFELARPYSLLIIPNPDLHQQGQSFRMVMSMTSTQDPIGYDEVCGDGNVGGQERCDADDTNGATCRGEGFTDGALSCSDTCAFDTSACTTCPNGVREGAEVCDGADLGGQTCQDLDYPGGALGCASDCGGVDTSGCDRCDPFSTTDCAAYPANQSCRADGRCGNCTDNSECAAPFVCFNSFCQLF